MHSDGYPMTLNRISCVSELPAMSITFFQMTGQVKNNSTFKNLSQNPSEHQAVFEHILCKGPLRNISDLVHLKPT